MKKGVGPICCLSIFSSLHVNHYIYITSQQTRLWLPYELLKLILVPTSDVYPYDASRNHDYHD